MRFEHPIYLLLLIGALLVALGQMSYSRRVLRRWGSYLPAAMLSRISLSPLGVYSRRKSILLAGIIILLALALANPQWAEQNKPTNRKSADVVLALDISKSMNTDDVSPTRLARAKLIANDIIEQLQGNRIAVVLFSGSAFVQLPLTTDAAAARLMLRSANSDMITVQGTNIADAINQALRALLSDGLTKPRPAALILLTDGEDHEGGLEQALTAANERGLSIYPIGIGTTTGGVVPREGGDSAVVSRLDEKTLQSIAEATNGQYLNLNNNPNPAPRLKRWIAQYETTTATQNITVRQSYFPILVALTLLLLVAESLLPRV